MKETSIFAGVVISLAVSFFVFYLALAIGGAVSCNSALCGISVVAGIVVFCTNRILVAIEDFKQETIKLRLDSLKISPVNKTKS